MDGTETPDRVAGDWIHCPAAGHAGPGHPDRIARQRLHHPARAAVPGDRRHSGVAGDVDRVALGEAAPGRLWCAATPGVRPPVPGRTRLGIRGSIGGLVHPSFCWEIFRSIPSPSGPALIEYALGWGVVFMAVALHEEFGFRGYLLFTFSRRVGFWRAALLLSLLFAGAHIPNPGETPLGILHVLMIGVIWCFTIPPNGDALVCRGLPCGVGLGGDVLLRYTRQRLAGCRPIPDHVRAWPGVGDRRAGGPQGERDHRGGDADRRASGAPARSRHRSIRTGQPNTGPGHSRAQALDGGSAWVLRWTVSSAGLAAATII